MEGELGFSANSQLGELLSAGSRLLARRAAIINAHDEDGLTSASALVPLLIAKVAAGAEGSTDPTVNESSLKVANELIKLGLSDLQKMESTGFVSHAVGTRAQSNAATMAVQIYDGYEEKVIRLMYPFGRYGGPAGAVALTVLPDGEVEMLPKPLKVGEERALTSYAYPQTMEGDEAVIAVAKKISSYEADKVVFRRGDQSYALSQSWRGNVDERFAAKYNLYLHNIDPSAFIPQAVDEFRYSLKRIFGIDEAEELPGPIIYARMKEFVPHAGGFVRGTWTQIVDYLTRSNEETAVKLREMLTGITDKSFTTKTFGDDGLRQSDVAFNVPATGEIALYVKSGHRTMVTSTPWHQFVGGRRRLSGESF